MKPVQRVDYESQNPRRRGAHKESPLLWLVPVLAVCAAGLAGVIAWLEMQGVGCGSAGCTEAFGSVWSHWWKIPVAIPAVAVYVVMLCASLLALTAGTPALRRNAWSVLVVVAIIVSCATLWFTTIQLALLEQVCPLCLTDHALGFAAALLILTMTPIWRSSRSCGPAVRPPVLVIPAGVMVVVLIVGQVIIPHFSPPVHYTVKDYPEIKETPPAPPNISSGVGTSTGVTPPVPPVTVTPDPPITPPTPPTTAPVGPTPSLVDNEPLAPRQISAAGGRVIVNMADWPTLGPRDAKYVAVLMFDYGCPICRQLHPILEKAIKEYGGQVAIVSIVVPLNSECNKAVAKTDPHHINSCDYARDSLAVFRADRGKWGEYDHWFFDRKEPPTPAQAKARAEELVGVDNFARALADPFVELHVKESVGLYQSLGGGNIPKLIMPNKAVEGKIENVEWLYQIFQSHLHVDPPALPKP